jgi:ubiquinone/menaquinone biosynthesis C-methylase UbiE
VKYETLKISTTMSEILQYKQYNMCDFEKNYHALRAVEKRIYTSHQIARLPEIESDHVHHDEWVFRKRSSEQLMFFLEKKKKKLKILDVGCGNGWLSAKLAQIQNAEVIGIDINTVELNQAKIVFANHKNLHFILEDLNSYQSLDGKFDIIIFAASLQYFSSLPRTLQKALSILNPFGEVHIIDTPLYKKDQISGAAKRTKEYYSATGFQKMIDFYFHHGIAELNQFPHKILASPNNLFRKLRNAQLAFPYILIENKI